MPEDREISFFLRPIYGQDKAEKCLIYPWNMPENGVRIPAISLCYAWDEMIALWTHDSLTLAFCDTFSNIILQ